MNTLFPFRKPDAWELTDIVRVEFIDEDGQRRNASAILQDLPQIQWDNMQVPRGRRRDEVRKSSKWIILNFKRERPRLLYRKRR